jgi:phosphate transport system permease protein
MMKPGLIAGQSPEPPRRLTRRRGHFPERGAELLLLSSAVVSGIAIVFIGVFVAQAGIPFMFEHGFWSFLAGTSWQPHLEQFGILPMIAGSLAVTACALAFGAPLGLATAAYLAEFAPRRLAAPVRQSIQLLAGIPSVVYGFYGMVTLVPLIRRLGPGPGFSVLAGGAILAVMVLPTLVTLGEDAIKAVPPEYREGSLALGATRWQTMVLVLLPAARSGLMAAVVLAMGRAVGETMAMIMVTGNVARFPGSLLAPVRTLTANVALEMGYAHGTHRGALFATGMVLFVFVMGLNLLARSAWRGGKQR